MQNGDFRFHRRSLQHRAGLLHLLTYLCYLGVDWIWLAVHIHNRAMILFPSVQGISPLPVTHGVSTVADIVPHGRTHLSRWQHPSGVCEWTGSCLHNPKVLLFEAARQIVHCAVRYRIQSAEWVIPGCKVEIFADDIVIESVVPPHHIGCNSLPRIGI